MNLHDRSTQPCVCVCDLFKVSDPYSPFTNSTVEDFTVGTEKCDNKVGYCNGPLKPGASYRFKVRAYTTRDQVSETTSKRDTPPLTFNIAFPLHAKFAETSWSSAYSTDPDNTAVLAVGIITPILLIVGAVIAYIVYKSR